MIATPAILWSRFQRHFLDCPTIGLGLDISRVPFPDDFHSKMERPIQKALSDMAQLERGAIANPDGGPLLAAESGAGSHAGPG
jgi:glucose-6-phosphate isomerase